MIEIPGQIPAEAAGKAGNSGGQAGPADVHAMKTHMNRGGSAGELSALFSAQLGRRTPQADKGAPPGTDPADPIGKDPEKKGADPGADREASELARQVAEHILVSDPDHLDPGEAGEVRIKVRERILKDTTIHLKQMPDRLKVRMVTGDPGSARILEAAKPALVSRLEDHFTGRIDVKTQYLPREETHERP